MIDVRLFLISVRPEVLAGTIEAYRRFVPWVGSATVVAPARLAADFRALDVDIDLHADEDVTGLTTDRLATMSHQRRNFLVRRAATENLLHDPIFLMADDDARPMRPITREDFVVEDHLVPYAFHRLAAWEPLETDFDAGQHATWAALTTMGIVDPPSFASHMPQIVDRRLAVDAWARAVAVGGDAPLCEWSTYFNIAINADPGRFTEPKTYQTLGWPQFPHLWPLWRRPERPAWENHHPEMYAERGLFAGLAPVHTHENHEQMIFEKLRRWRTLEARVAALDIPDDIDQPFTDGSPGRRLAFRSMRRLRQIRRYLELDGASGFGR